ncbi:hypothetical protein AVEN_1216-1, partial [Araneus ventricosus]
MSWPHSCLIGPCPLCERCGSHYPIILKYLLSNLGMPSSTPLRLILRELECHSSTGNYGFTQLSPFFNILHGSHCVNPE